MKYDLKLRPIHYASLSGGKDSLYMLGVILSNLEKYPLDMVVNFDLEIEWDVSKRVIDYIEQKCRDANIKFVRIKPRKTWRELYDRYGFPNGRARWCNNPYKIDCKRQLNEWIREQNCRPIAYIGFCADEVKRFRFDIANEDWKLQDECYPLAEEGIEESFILQWARKQDIFSDYYKLFDRMGCKMCPMASMLEWAYFLKKEPKEYEESINLIKNTELKVANSGRNYSFKKMTAEEFDYRIRNKWLPKLEEKMLSVLEG